jgi:hypothetical protein
MDAVRKGSPLYKRSWSFLTLPLASMAVAWLVHRPTQIPQILVSVFLGGAILWFFFASPLIWRLMNHRVPVVRGVVFVISVAGGVWGIYTLVPYVHRLVA